MQDSVKNANNWKRKRNKLMRTGSHFSSVQGRALLLLRSGEVQKSSAKLACALRRSCLLQQEATRKRRSCAFPSCWSAAAQVGPEWAGRKPERETVWMGFETSERGGSGCGASNTTTPRWAKMTTSGRSRKNHCYDFVQLKVTININVHTHKITSQCNF